MRHFLFILLAASCFAFSTEAAEQEVDCGARPVWCQPGYICAPTACVTALREDLEQTKIDLRHAQRASRRLHLDLACGPAPFSTALTDNYGMHAFPSPLACVIGVAIRIGK